MQNRQPHIIAIAGGSCSGKTTLAQQIQTHLGQDNCCLIQQDNYYKGLAHITNFDVPEAIDFALLAEQLSLLKSAQPIAMPTYDFVTHRRKPDTVMLQPTSLILVDGILILHAEELRASFDYKVFVACSEVLRRQRRLQRDVCERGREHKATLKQFDEQTVPMHERYVEPSRQYADLVHTGEQDTSTLINYCLNRLEPE